MEPRAAETPVGKATTENPLHKFAACKLMKLVEVLPTESVAALGRIQFEIFLVTFYNPSDSQRAKINLFIGLSQ